MEIKKQVRSKRKSGRKGVKLVRLTPEQVKRLPRPHVGFDKFAPELAALYEAKPELLRVTGLSGAQITDAVQAYLDLRAQEVAAEAQLALIQNSRLFYSSVGYQKMLTVYLRCKSVSKSDPDIRQAIAAFEQFMKSTGRRAKKSGSGSSTRRREAVRHRREALRKLSRDPWEGPGIVMVPGPFSFGGQPTVANGALERPALS